MSKTIGDQSADGPGTGSDLIQAVSLNLPMWFSPTMELKPPQPFKKSVKVPNSKQQKGFSLNCRRCHGCSSRCGHRFRQQQVKVIRPVHELWVRPLLHPAAIHRPLLTSPHSVITWRGAAWRTERKACWKQLCLSEFTKKEMEDRTDKRGEGGRREKG